jgi:hypothetical protein
MRGARRYLLASRYRSELRFAPTGVEPQVQLAWDELEPTLRLSICQEVGADEAAAGCPGGEVDVALRELISWRFEVLRRVRIVFDPTQPERLAG